MTSGINDFDISLKRETCGTSDNSIIFSISNFEYYAKAFLNTLVDKESFINHFFQTFSKFSLF